MFFYRILKIPQNLGTETRVNAQAQAYEYMTNYSESCEPVGRLEKVKNKFKIVINGPNFSIFQSTYHFTIFSTIMVL